MIIVKIIIADFDWEFAMSEVLRWALAGGHILWSSGWCEVRRVISIYAWRFWGPESWRDLPQVMQLGSGQSFIQTQGPWSGLWEELVTTMLSSSVVLWDAIYRTKPVFWNFEEEKLVLLKSNFTSFLPSYFYIQELVLKWRLCSLSCFSPNVFVCKVIIWLQQ